MSDSLQLLAQQVVPYSQEAEEAVIGAILVNPGAFLTVASFLKADDFFLLRHGYIWTCVERIAGRNDPIDNLTITQELKDMGWLNEIGGPAYITHLINNTPSSIHAEVYGRLVERAAVRRRLLETADDIKALALNEEMAIESVTNEAEARLFSVTERQLKREFVPLWEAASAYYDRMEQILQSQQGALGLPSGFKDLDQLLGGLQKSDLIIFAGRPGMGKTSFMLSTALNAARIGARIAVFTMEMPVEQIVQRLIAMETGINMQKLRLGQLSAQESSRFTEAISRISHFPIFIDDTPALTPLQMRTKCRRLMHEHGIDLVIVDYMQLMSGDGHYESNRVQEISYISRSMKELARELNVPLFSAAQLSRAVEQRQDKRPVLSDLRESGCVAGETLIYLPDEGRYVPIRTLCGKKGLRVTSINTDTWKLETATVSNAFCTGVKRVYHLTTRLGRTVRATGNHKFLTIDGWKRLDQLTEGSHVALPRVLAGPSEQTLHHDLGNAFCGTGLYKQNISRDRAARLAQAVQSPTIANLAESNIYWDRIVSIEPDGETDVYDLTVPGNSNFVGDNFILHNSIEQDSDVVMFLYRDVMYNEATEFPNQADVIVSKHRNGPTGTVSLYFDRTITKFMDASVRRVDLSDL